MTARAPSALTTWRRRALRQLKASRRETLALLKRLPEDAILRPRTQDQWSVKDVLGHLLACDEETVRRFSLIARGRADRIHWFESMADADRFNARTVARLRRVSLRAILGGATSAITPARSRRGGACSRSRASAVRARAPRIRRGRCASAGVAGCGAARPCESRVSGTASAPARNRCTMPGANAVSICVVEHGHAAPHPATLALAPRYAAP
ncbi:MAG: hypothetical protein DMD85_23395 [Candidatus Rokuibacteriota bacterium]|nr:MAG: hypothetical protein DMD85_23395 [Candidatus Rokubacteria bacterium]